MNKLINECVTDKEKKLPLVGIVRSAIVNTVSETTRPSDVVLDHKKFGQEDEAKGEMNRMKNINDVYEASYIKANMTCLNPEVTGKYLISRWENTYVKLPYV